MITYNDAEILKQQAIEFNRYSIRLWLVLSLILSLAVIFILSGKPLLDHRPIYAATLVVPISCALYFRNRIVMLGPSAYVAALTGMLGAALCFGI